MRTTPQNKQVVTVAYISGSKLSTCTSRFEDGWFIPTASGLGGTRVIAWQEDGGRWQLLEEWPTTVEEIRAEISRLEADLSRISGEPLDLEYHDLPSGGAILEYSPAVSEYSFRHWYPSLEAAKAALLKMARDAGTTPDPDGLHADLSPPAAQYSTKAWITRR